jgi:hypothetical protein
MYKTVAFSRRRFLSFLGLNVAIWAVPRFAAAAQPASVSPNNHIPALACNPAQTSDDEFVFVNGWLVLKRDLKQAIA